MILDDLYFGQLHPAETIVPNDPEYSDAIQKASNLVKSLTSEMDDNMASQFDDYVEMISIATSLENECSFKYGFACGVDLMTDIIDLLKRS